MRKQLIDLREKMRQYGIDAYLIPTTDFHGSEYVNDYFKCRKYVSGFTGSAGTIVVTDREACLWTDGRYFLQARNQLAGSGIDLMKMGQPGVPTVSEYLKKNLKAGNCLGFDGRVVDWTFAHELEEKFSLRFDLDLVDEIWPDRPQIHPSSIYALPLSVTGETTESKMRRLRSCMREKGAEYHLITKLEEIAYLYNLRGDDVEHTPVFFAFALVSQDDDRLYVLDPKYTEANARPYLQIFEDLKHLDGKSILLDRNVASYSLVKSIPETVKIIDGEDPVALMKSFKNDAEIESTRNAHIKDGVAMAQFIYYLKTGIGKTPMTEISVSEHLEQLRRQEGCFDISFDTISGYNKNGAVIHYFATEETNQELRPEGFLLVDSGGQYRDGTTDITRTIALGPLTDEMKENYTAVLRCHIALASAVFPVGTTGAQLDALTRRPLKEIGLDYNHGTGHGVGHILCVHEGPQLISPKGTEHTFSPGIITSDEPGVYLEGKYGIRLENELLCVDKEGGTYGFEPLTVCPWEPEAILVEKLTEAEKQWLNDYHAAVYEKLSPYLEEEIRLWLKEETRPI